MAESKLPSKDNKGNDIIPHITKPIVETDEVKDSVMKKAAKMIFAEDIDRVTDSIVDDFVKPRAKSYGNDLLKQLKEFIYNSIKDFTGRLLWGEGSSPKSTTYGKGGTVYTSYSKYGGGYSTGEYNTDDYYWYNGSYYKSNTTPEKTPHDIVRERPIKDCGKAQEVLDELRYIIKSSDEHYVSVGDYYIAVGAPVNKLDYDYVWTGNMLDKCKTRPTRHGYVLDLPRPVPKQ